MEWNKVSEKELPFGKEVIAFNKEWINSDFNPNGTRIGFLQDDGFVSATWNDDQDCYDTCYEEGDDYYNGISGIPGAAKVARNQFSAIYGQGEGLQGNAYALPTKDLRVRENRGLRSISKEDIVKSIKKLYETARQYSDKQFKIAYRNTYSASLNGYTGLEMIDMFLEAGPIPDNIIFSKEWVDTGKL